MLFIFDMGGVVTHDEGFDKRLGNILGISREEFDSVCSARGGSGGGRPDIMLSLSNGEITAKQFWAEFALRSGIKVAGEPWSLVFNPRRDAKVVSLIGRLREKHRVVSGTNTIECHYMEHIERGDYAIFDKVYASNRIGISKPNPDFWKTILMAEETSAEDAFFIDDREENCNAAANLGIGVYRFRDARALEAAVKDYL